MKTRVAKLLTLPFLALLALISIGSVCCAFDLSTHRTILLNALHRGSMMIGGQNLPFDLDVVMKIDEENGALDRGSLISADPVWHVDDEKIAASNSRIIDLRSQIISKLTDSNPQIQSARALLGRAFYILTDFYAHTNWIELGNTEPNDDFGVRTLSNPLAQSGEATCAEDGATLTLAGLAKLTSGYYGGVGSCDIPAGKCRHGGPSQCSRGLSKDPPTSPRHDDAVKMASDAVKTFVQDLLNEVANSGHQATVTRFARQL
jgi:hypothetical protein